MCLVDKCNFIYKIKEKKRNITHTLKQIARIRFNIRIYVRNGLLGVYYMYDDFRGCFSALDINFLAYDCLV